MDLNKVMIIGRLTRDPELKTTPSGANVCTIGIATNYVYTNQATGQKVEQVEFHNIVLWRKLADIAAQYLKKGGRVYIEGRLSTRSWDSKEGEKKSRTEIVGDNMIMLDSKGGAPSEGGASSYNNGGNENSGSSAPAFNPRGQAKDKESQVVDDELPTIQQEEDINVEDIPF